MLLEQLAEALHEGPEALLVHGGKQLEEHLALTEERVLSGPGSAEPALHAKLLSGFAEQGQQGVCERGQEEEEVSPVVALDHRLLQPQSQPRVLEVSKRLLDREAFAIQVFDCGAFEVISAAGEQPRLLHLLLLHADHDRHRLASSRHTRASKHAHPPAHAEPILRLAPLPIGRLDVDNAAKADDIVEPKFLLEESVELRVGEAAVGQDGDVYPLGQHVGEQAQQIVLMGIALVLELGAPHGLPHQRRAAAVRGVRPKYDHRLVGVLKLGPVKVDQKLLALGHHEAHPAAGDVFPQELAVRQKSVDLLDRMARSESVRHSEAVADGANPEIRRMQHPIDPVAERCQALRVDLASEHPTHQLIELLPLDDPLHFLALCSHSLSPAVRGACPGSRDFYTNSTVYGTEGTPQG